MTLSIVIDVNLSPEWSPYLSASGIQAEHWSTIGPVWASDVEIMSWAVNHGRVVLTHDLDFGTLLALTHAEGPSVVTIRGRRVLPDDVGLDVVGVLKKFNDLLLAGALIVYDQRHSRVRLLPF